MKLKRILIVVEQPGFNLLNRFSAVSSVIYSFAELLSRNGYEVYVNEDSMLSFALNDRTYTPKYVVARFSGLYKIIPKRVREIVKDILLFRNLKRLAGSLENIPKPDIVISWISYGSSACVNLARKWEVPLISIFDHPLCEEYKFLFGFNPFFRKRIERHENEILLNSRAIITYSPSVEEFVKSRLNIKDVPFYHMAFTDFKRMFFGEYERDLSVVKFAYIGSFFNWHKLYTLIDAFEQVHLRGHNFELYLIGNGPDFKKVKGRVDKLPWKNKIILTGALDGVKLDQIMKKLHIGIVSNALWFQGPVKLFQYSAAQLCVISKKTPTISSLFGQSKGFLFFDSLTELVNRIVYLIDNKENLKLLGVENQKFILENYTEKNYLTFFNNIFSHL